MVLLPGIDGGREAFVRPNVGVDRHAATLRRDAYAHQHASQRNAAAFCVSNDLLDITASAPAVPFPSREAFGKNGALQLMRRVLPIWQDQLVLPCHLQDVGVSHCMEYYPAVLRQVMLQIASISPATHLLMMEARLGIGEFQGFALPSTPKPRSALGRTADVQKILRIKLLQAHGLGECRIQNTFTWAVIVPKHPVFDPRMP
jgi:hypothetical protein